MGTLDNILNMSPETAQNLQNFGFATMAASQQPGITTLAALGQGGLGMNQAAQQNAQTQNIKQEGVSRQLNNALTLRQLNMGNMMYGLPPVNVQGVQNLMPQQQDSSAPSGASAGQAWGQSAGMSVPSGQQRTQLSNNAQVASIPIPQTLANMGFTQAAYDFARGIGSPQSRNDMIQAAQLKQIMGDAAGAKEIQASALKATEPFELRPGGSRVDPFGNTTVNPAHLQDVNGNTVPFAPPPVTYGKNNRNAGRGLSNIPAIPEIPDSMQSVQAPNGATAPSENKGIKTGWSPQEKTTQENYFGKETDSYNGAVKSLQNLQLMQHSIDTLNQDGSYLKTGTWGEKKLAIAKALQSAGVNAVDPNEIAAGESLLKTTGRLGFDMSKQLGAREPGVITQQAIKLNPGIENTPQGVQLLHDSVAEEAQRIIDEHNFKGSYYQNGRYNQQKAEAEFDSKYPPALYAKRATSQTNPIAVNTPAGAKQLLAGTKIKTPNGKIGKVKAGIGITPPSYQSVIQPQATQNVEEPEAE